MGTFKHNSNPNKKLNGNQSKLDEFKIMSSNSPDQTGKKQEWLKQTEKSDVFDASIKNTESSRELASETKDFDANEKTEFSKPASKTSKKSAEKTHSSKSIDDPLKLEIVSSDRKKVTIYFSAFGEELRFDGEDVVISTAYYFQIRYNDVMIPSYERYLWNPGFRKIQSG